MRTWSVITILGLLASGCIAAEPAVKEHVEQITKANQTYKITMGGTLDGFNTADYPETYNDCRRLESKFEPNKYVTIENIGDTDVIDPRLVINGRRDWFSADDILAGILKPNMTDSEKAMAIYNLCSGIDVQCHENDRRPGPETPDDKSNPSRNSFCERADPVKALNSYYCGGCQYAAANMAILCRQAGLPARADWVNKPDTYGNHCVTEVWYDNAWHLFDPDERTYFLDIDNVTVASYETLHNNPSLVSRTHVGGFASPGKKDRSSQYKDIFPPHIMSVDMWLSTMSMRLRPGETITRRWDNINKFHTGDNKRNVKPERPQGLAPYQLANGKLIYQPRLNGACYQRGILSELNIVPVSGPAGERLQPQAAGWPAYVIYKVSSPYPVVGGAVSGRFFKKTSKDTCRVQISVRDGDWKDIFSADKEGESECKAVIDEALDPKPAPAIYEYYVKFELSAASEPADVWLSSIYIETDLQMAATSLPALSVGSNKVVYSDKSPGGRKVRITHGWTESSANKPPLAPLPLDAVNPECLAWEPTKDPNASPIADYHIQVSPRKDFLYPVSPNFNRIVQTDRPQWQLPSGWLKKGQSYYWRIRARNSFGAWSVWSKTGKFKME